MFSLSPFVRLSLSPHIPSLSFIVKHIVTFLQLVSLFLLPSSKLFRASSWPTLASLRSCFFCCPLFFHANTICHTGLSGSFGLIGKFFVWFLAKSCWQFWRVDKLLFADVLNCVRWLSSLFTQTLGSLVNALDRWMDDHISVPGHQAFIVAHLHHVCSLQVCPGIVIVGHNLTPFLLVLSSGMSYAQVVQYFDLPLWCSLFFFFSLPACLFSIYDIMFYVLDCWVTILHCMTPSNVEVMIVHTLYGLYVKVLIELCKILCCLSRLCFIWSN